MNERPERVVDVHLHYMPGTVEEDEILRNMDAAGVEAAVVLAVPDHERYRIKRLTGTNERVAELVRRHPKRFVGAVYINPLDNLEAQTTLRRYRDLGFPMAKAWPAHGFSPDDPRVYPVWDTLNELKMGILFHMGGTLGTLPEGPLATVRRSAFNVKHGHPSMLDQPARFFPDVPFVVGHAAFPWTLEALLLACVHPNVHIEFSCPLGFEAYNLVQRLDPCRHMRGGFPFSKVLFGSDSAGRPGEGENPPWAGLPAWTRLAQEPPLQGHAEDFFHANARRLLRTVGWNPA